MQRELIPLYGPLAINSFGLFLILGLMLFSFLLLKDSRRPILLSIDQYYTLLSLAIVAGLLGARLLYFFEQDSIDSWKSFFLFWQGGLSLLGGIIALLIMLPIYLKKERIPLLPFLDLAATYAPLLQSVARIGCFFAGCCFGIPTIRWWGTASHVESISLCLHPTQLYSATILFIIFIGIYTLGRFFKRPGQIFSLYLISVGLERFFIDFWRGDRIFLKSWHYLSLSQVIALSIVLLSSIALSYFTFLPQRTSS